MGISAINKYQLIDKYDDICVQVHAGSGVVNHSDLSSVGHSLSGMSRGWFNKAATAAPSLYICPDPAERKAAGASCSCYPALPYLAAWWEGVRGGD